MRMFNIWQDRGFLSVSEQRLAHQVRQNREKCWLTAVEIEELSRHIIIDTNESREEVVTNNQELQEENM